MSMCFTVYSFSIGQQWYWNRIICLETTCKSYSFAGSVRLVQGSVCYGPLTNR